MQEKRRGGNYRHPRQLALLNEGEIFMPNAKPLAAGKRVLLVEDSQDEALMLTLLLDQLGCSCVVATNADEALKNVKAGKFDLVLMDVHMPGADGLAATRSIRSWEDDNGQGRHKIIGLTGLIKDREYFRAAGMDDCILKPLRLSELQSKLAAA
jgi:CheY-like chemotaxis protein